MRIPPTPPSWRDRFEEEPDFFLRTLHLAQNPTVQKILRKADDNYLHWQTFRYQPHPEDIEMVDLWSYLAYQRETNRRALPIEFSNDQPLTFWIPPKHQEWLHNIDRDAGGRMPNLEWPMPSDERYLFGSLMEEAIASSQLEGAATTREVAKKMLRQKKKPKSKPEQMIANNYKAILELRDNRRAKLTPDLLCRIQEMLTEDTLDDPKQSGRFRTSDESVAVIDGFTKGVIYEAPHAATVPYRVEEICDFANESSNPFVHPVIKAAILHFAIGFVHPFADGNGRTARAVFYWYMLKRGYWPFEYLSISRIFLNAPAKYARAYLYVETDHGDVNYFVHFHLQVILRSIKELHLHLKKKQSEFKKARDILDSQPDLNHRQTALICHALKHPDTTYTIRQYEGTNHISYATARSDLLDLAERTFIDQKWQGNKMVFFPSPLLAEKVKDRKTVD